MDAARANPDGTKLCKEQKLSEEFIREWVDRVDWWVFSQSQDLSESFIREFRDRVHWWVISKHQVLSRKFIHEFKRKLLMTPTLKKRIQKLQVIATLGLIDKIPSDSLDLVESYI